MRISDWSSDVCSSDLDSASPHASQEKISKREFLDLPHAVYGLGADRQLSLADRHLAKLGVTRRIEVTVESFLLVPFLIQGTRLTTLVLERAANLLAGHDAISKDKTGSATGRTRVCQCV